MALHLKTLRQTFLDTEVDMKWLFDTHLKPANRIDMPTGYVFASALLYGNEDCPQLIDLWVSREPLVTDTALRATLGEDGKYSFTYFNPARMPQP